MRAQATPTASGKYGQPNCNGRHSSVPRIEGNAAEPASSATMQIYAALRKQIAAMMVTPGGRCTAWLSPRVSRTLRLVISDGVRDRAELRSTGQPRAAVPTKTWADECVRPYVVLGGALNWSATSPRDKYQATITRTIIPRPPNASALGWTITVAADTDGTSITMPAMAINIATWRTMLFSSSKPHATPPPTMAMSRNIFGPDSSRPNKSGAPADIATVPGRSSINAPKIPR